MKTAAVPSLRYVRAISERMFAPYSDLRMAHASSTKMNFRCSRGARLKNVVTRCSSAMTKTAWSDGVREDPELLRVEPEALLAAGSHLGEHVGDEHLVISVARPEARIEGDDGVRFHREVLSALELREAAVAV